MTLKTTAMTLCATLLTFGALTATAHSQETETVNATARSISSGTMLHNPLAISWESKGNDKVMKVVDADTPSGKAISARTKKRKKKAWDVALWTDLEGGVQKGDQVEMQFWARTAKAPKGKDVAEFGIFVGRNIEPYDTIINQDFSPTSEWKLHTLTGTANADFSPGKLKAEYQLGKNIQTVEFGAMYLKNLGPQIN